MNSSGVIELFNLDFFITEAWTGFKRSGIMSLVSIGTITVSLVIFGAFLLAVLNIGNVVSQVGSRLEVMTYVDADLSADRLDEMKLKFERLDGVENVKFISKDEAWSSFKSSFAGSLNLDSSIAGNPLPNTFILRVRNVDMVAYVANTASKVPGAEEVRYSGDLADKIRTLAGAVRIGGLILVSLLSFATLLIVVNTIRLTVLARETDISIMKLVGATDSFIKWPFIIEGVIIGLVGSALSVLILFSSYELIASRISEAVPFIPIVFESGSLFVIYGMVALVGTFLGMLGGYISVSKSLKE
jgi:cell division transport system permease protein